MSQREQLRFLHPEQVREIRSRFGSPVFVYDHRTLEKRAREVLTFPNAYGLTARYAMKALPTAAILQLLMRTGLHLDASSGFEVERALLAGFPAHHIQLTAQQLPIQLDALINQGVLFNACSLHQLQAFGSLFPGKEVSVRINPGLGSGGTNRTNVGGPASSFGIWHEQLEDILSIARRYQLTISRMHTHIGSGSDASVWAHCARLSLNIAARLPEVGTLSLGGGYKVGRMHDEPSADLQKIGQSILPEFEQFAQKHGRKLHLEVEPGTYLVAQAGALISTVIDETNTGQDGYHFLKLDAGMTEVLRPSLYGAQHPLVSISAAEETQNEEKEYIVVGHCCESGDIFTPAPGDPETLQPRKLRKTKLGDLMVIEGVGAYCVSMASKNYNSFPECAEVLLTASGELKLIRQRQQLEQIIQNEQPLLDI